MELAHRYLNAIQIIGNDAELKEAVMADFKRVMVNNVRNPEYPGMSLIIFDDLSSIFSFDKEQIIVETPKEFFKTVFPFNEKHPKIKEFLKWMVSDAAARKMI